MPQDDEKKNKESKRESEYESIEYLEIEDGPDPYSVVLTWKDKLPPGTALRISVSDLEFFHVKLKGNEYVVDNPEKLLPPNNVYAVKVTEKPVELGDNLKKIIQPNYAIGMNIISTDEYNNLKNEYMAQSELSLGLIIPLILVVLGLSLMPQIGLGPTADVELWWGLLHALAWSFICAALTLICMGLFVVGAERYQKYRMELKLLILGNWQQQQDAKKKQAASDADAAASSSKAIQQAVAKAIEKAGLAQGSLMVKVDEKISGS